MSKPIVCISRKSQVVHISLWILDSLTISTNLGKRLVVVASPQEAISRTVRIYRADDGRIIRDEESLDHTFDAEAAPKQLEKLVGECSRMSRNDLTRLSSCRTSCFPGLSPRYVCAAASNRARLPADTWSAIRRQSQSASLLPWLSDARLLHNAPLPHPIDALLPQCGRPCAQREDPAGS